MADTTSAGVTIHACPPHRVRSVLDILDEYGLHLDHSDATEHTAAGERAILILGTGYEIHEFRAGDAVELADVLIQRTPEIVFSLHEEPAYEWVGTCCTYVPGLGVFIAACDTSGEAMFTQSDILRLDDEPDETRRGALGVPWLTAITALPEGTVCEPEPFATHWNRGSGTVHVLSGTPLGASLVLAAPGDAAAVDTVLAEHGWLRANEWTDLDDTGHLARTDLYRHLTS